MPTQTESLGAADSSEEPPVGLDRTQVRYLTPETCRVHLGTHGALHVTVVGERIYGGVYAAYAFPVAHSEGYISLIHTIRRINQVRWRHGLVAFDVETDKGHVEFMMRWRHSRAVDYGRRGKILIDVDDNRYLIPDVQDLPPKQRSAFTRIIYW